MINVNCFGDGKFGFVALARSFKSYAEIVYENWPLHNICYVYPTANEI